MKDGAQVFLRSTRRLSSKKEKEGNEVAFEVSAPVKLDDLIVIPAHAPAFGKIIKVQRSRRRVKPGSLEITLERVRLVDGQWAQLQWMQQEAGKPENKVAEVIATVSVLTIVYSPVGLAAILLAHGQEATVPEGYHLTASVNGDVLLDRAAVLKAQSLPETAKPADGSVLVYWFAGEDTKGERVSCGDTEIGTLHSGQALRLDLPPGRYWFRTVGVKVRRELRSLPPEYKAIDVESGKSSYLTLTTADFWTKLERMQLREIDGSTAQPELDGIADRPKGLRWVQEHISKLQAHPGALNPQH